MESTKDCPECNGTGDFEGYYRHTCQFCDGVGVVTESRYNEFQKRILIEKLKERLYRMDFGRLKEMEKYMEGL